MTNLAGKRVFVTGATGFIGGRLVERLLLNEDARVTSLVHNFKNASRLARFDSPMIGGDVTDLHGLRKAADGCDYIVHAAVTFAGTSDRVRSVVVDGTANVCRVAHELNVKLVHLSTFSVYGETPNRTVDETLPKKPTDAYGKNKLAAERKVDSFRNQGLQAVVLQPTVVYGPWAFWSTYPRQQLSEGRFALPDGGGLCNHVYVDDVVDAILLGLTSDANETCLISGSDPVTWRQYFCDHVPEQYRDRLLELSAEKLRRHAKRWQSPLAPGRAVLKACEHPHARKLLGSIPYVGRTIEWLQSIDRFECAPEFDDDLETALPAIDHAAMFAARTVVSTGHAKSVLGYEPRFDFQTGVEMTRQWADWARLGV